VSSITDATNAIATSQVALPRDTCRTVYATTGYEASVSNLEQVSLDTDNVFGDDGGEPARHGHRQRRSGLPRQRRRRRRHPDDAERRRDGRWRPRPASELSS
jgi:hypothetical protein